jgi:hypothetical protein
MTKAMTGSFYLTETIAVPAGTLTSVMTQGSIDLGAYVSVPNGQAVAIESVDFVYQLGGDYAQEGSSFLQTSGAVQVQLSDLNPGTAMVRADNQALIASGSLNIDQANNIVSHAVDLYPGWQ